MYFDKFYIEHELSSFYTIEKKKKDTAIQFTSSLLLHFLKKNVEARLGYLKDTGRAGETWKHFSRSHWGSNRGHHACWTRALPLSYGPSFRWQLLIPFDFISKITFSVWAGCSSLETVSKVSLPSPSISSLLEVSSSLAIGPFSHRGVWKSSSTSGG